MDGLAGATGVFSAFALYLPFGCGLDERNDVLALTALFGRVAGTIGILGDALPAPIVSRARNTALLSIRMLLTTPSVSTGVAIT